MRIMGIDPGLSGGAFIYDTDTTEFQSYVLERHESRINQNAFLSFLVRQSPDFVLIEKILLTGREGGQSAMTIGSNYGRLCAALEFCNLSYAEIPPKMWQRSLGLKSGSRAIVKQSAQDLAVKRFTILPFLHGKSKKPHDGLTDAACIALYGINYLSENLWKENKSTKSTVSSASSTEISVKRSSTSKTKKTKPIKSSKAKKNKSKSPTLQQDSRSVRNSKQLKIVGKN